MSNVIKMPTSIDIQKNILIDKILSNYQVSKMIVDTNKRADALVKRNHKLKRPTQDEDLRTLRIIMKRNLTTKTVKSESFYKEFISTRFNSFEDKQTAFLAWFRINSNEDIINALFLEVEDTHGNFCELERSIACGKRHKFPFEDFVQTDKGLMHKMLM